MLYSIMLISRKHLTIPHRRLLCKLKSYNSNNQLIAWIHNFVCEKKYMCICVNGEFPSWFEVLSGIPQGSIVGPLLFLVYILMISRICTPYKMPAPNDQNISLYR